jgi:hypothetical protein
MTRIRTYSELKRLETFEERYRYLALNGIVGQPTFGSERYMNQAFYRSHQWRRMRDFVIVRDEGSDLGILGREITDRLYIHHMNPMTIEDLRDGNEAVLEPEYLIATQFITHNAIHYGDENLLPKLYVPRRPGDTKLW